MIAAVQRHGQGERTNARVLKRSRLQLTGRPVTPHSGVAAGAAVAVFSSILTAAVSVLAVYVTLNGNSSMAHDDFRRSHRVDAYGRFLDRMDEAAITREHVRRTTRGSGSATARPQEIASELRAAGENLRRAGTTVDLLTNARASAIAKSVVLHHSREAIRLLNDLCLRLPKSEASKQNECLVNLTHSKSEEYAAREGERDVSGALAAFRSELAYGELREKFLDIARDDLAL
jgi:hypothetical protein